MLNYNLIAAWAGIMLGLITGALMGLFFHKEQWLGGYNSWPRRLLRLGHIAFFGIAFLNLAFVVTASQAGFPSEEIVCPAALLMVAQFTMPLVCMLSAFKKAMRYLFVVPVASTLGGTALVLVGLIHGVVR